MLKKNTYLNSNLQVDKLHMCWGAHSAHFTALAAGYTPEVVHCTTPSPSPPHTPVCLRQAATWPTPLLRAPHPANLILHSHQHENMLLFLSSMYSEVSTMSCLGTERAWSPRSLPKDPTTSSPQEPPPKGPCPWSLQTPPTPTPQPRVARQEAQSSAEGKVRASRHHVCWMQGWTHSKGSWRMTDNAIYLQQSLDGERGVPDL